MRHYTVADATKFCILTSQRSGSTWLKSLLDSHPQIRCFGELFLYRPWPDWPDSVQLPYYEYRRRNPGRRPAITGRYIGALTQYPGDHGALGFKLMYNQLAAFPEIAYALIKHRFRMIHLVRLNPLDVVISRQRMRKTGIHHGTIRPPAQAIQLDVSRLRGQLLGQEAMVRSARLLLKMLPLTHCEMTYEGLCTDRDACLNAAAHFLGVDDGTANYQSALQKLGTESYRERIANYDQVRAKLYGTRFARLLAEKQTN